MNEKYAENYFFTSITKNHWLINMVPLPVVTLCLTAMTQIPLVGSMFSIFSLFLNVLVFPVGAVLINLRLQYSKGKRSFLLNYFSILFGTASSFAIYYYLWSYLFFGSFQSTGENDMVIQFLICIALGIETTGSIIVQILLLMKNEKSGPE